MLPKNRAPIHPGEILKYEFLDPLGLTLTAFAKHVNWPLAKVSEIVNGKRGVTPETALSLADVFGTTPDLWVGLQADYDIWQARQTHKKKPRLSKAC
ncbi:MAG: HigA family addiction module antitoxin [Vampirovibrionales bacterium]|nr:HigA family addiction module antitoxin [Vampirovibrionales bacterium]